MRTTANVTLSCLAAVGIWACSDHESLPEKTSTTVGASGGAATSADGLLQVEFGEGTIASDTNITIEIRRDEQTARLASAVYEVGPKELVLAHGARVTLQIPEGAALRAAHLVAMESGAANALAGTSYEAGQLAASVTRLSTFAAMAPAGEDADSDGFSSTTDCDDTDPSTSPAAQEVCDGKDNDCDGAVDEDCALCGNGVLEPGEECDDGNARDDDACTNVCIENGVDVDGDGEPAATDCNDDDPFVFPGATESCNAADDDCDGVIDDGYAAACGNGIVEDKEECDGTDDCSVACLLLSSTDADADGWAASIDCDDGDATVNPAAAEACDGKDNDCDGLIDNDCAVCGNGVVEPGEVCDGGEACNGTCQLVGSTTPQICTDPLACSVCGNGIVEAGEECDDGNADGADGCSMFCLLSAEQ